MDVSVIISTWNNCERLAVTLDAISQCMIPANLQWELVLVNNNCTDDTKIVAQEFTDNLPLVYVEEPQQGLSRAKNAGIRAASGELAVFTDDDMKPCQEWIGAYWSAYKEKPAGFYFGGPVLCEYETVEPEADLLQLAPPGVVGLDWGPEAKVLAADERLLANWACPSDAIRTLGGFDIRLGLDPSLGRQQVGELPDLRHRLRQLGMCAWYVPKAKVVHFLSEEKCTLEYLAARAEAHGVYWASSPNIVPFTVYRQPNLTSWCERPGTETAVISWRLYIQVLSLGFRWVWARALGRKGYDDYVALRFCLGMMKGLHKKSRDSKCQ